MAKFFDPMERIAQKAADREQDMRDLAEGRASIQEIKDRNSLARGLNMKASRIRLRNVMGS